MNGTGPNWIDLLLNGGGWTLAVAVGWAVMTGRLRLPREYDDLQQRIEKLTGQFEDAVAAINAARDREVQELRATNDRLHERLDRLIGSPPTEGVE